MSAGQSRAMFLRKCTIGHSSAMSSRSQNVSAQLLFVRTACAQREAEIFAHTFWLREDIAELCPIVHFRKNTALLCPAHITAAFSSLRVQASTCRVLCLRTTICGQHWFFDITWRKLLQNRIECLSKLTLNMLLAKHSVSSGSKNSKVVILMWETKILENHRKSAFSGIRRVLSIMSC